MSLHLFYSARDSGIGDYGPEGINAFVSQHKCNYICHGIKLDSLHSAVDKSADADEPQEESGGDSESGGEA